MAGQIANNEAQHVRYARALSRRHVPDEATLACAVVRFHAIERRAFADHTHAHLSHVLALGLIDVRAAEPLLLRAMR